MQMFDMGVPKDVFKVLHHHRIFDKVAYRNPTTPKKIDRESIWQYETTEFVKNNVFFVSQKYSEREDFKKKNALFINHSLTTDSQAILNYKYDYFNNQLFIFIKKEGDLWLKLTHTDPIFMGYPIRKSFDIAPMVLGKPIRVCINARAWHSWSARRATEYREWDFIFEYLGEFTHYQPNENPVWEEYKTKEIKLIDLRKELY
jgi:hypothetical protein